MIDLHWIGFGATILAALIVGWITSGWNTGESKVRWATFLTRPTSGQEVGGESPIS